MTNSPWASLAVVTRHRDDELRGLVLVAHHVDAERAVGPGLAALLLRLPAAAHLRHAVGRVQLKGGGGAEQGEEAEEAGEEHRVNTRLGTHGSDS